MKKKDDNFCRSCLFLLLLLFLLIFRALINFRTNQIITSKCFNKTNQLCINISFRLIGSSCGRTELEITIKMPPYNEHSLVAVSRRGPTLSVSDSPL